MTTSTPASAAIVDGYFRLLNSLSESSRLAVLARLEAESASQPAENSNRLLRAFGAWTSDETAEELVESIRCARAFTRQTEAF